ncbi:MAG: hypothetical protein CFE29_07830 [Bradyrhizobiaceae bacterium PARB1]|jgi:phage-related holin|nr:MAG: hypothetical protein CFE29_07830 [Bradyrhizobiaceae bacterium PARB1]
MSDHTADSAAPVQRTSSQVQPVRLRLPFAGPNIQKMLAVYFLLVFVFSGTVLDTLGYDYSAIEGSQITKIHPATYFIVVLFSVFVVSYPRKRDLVSYYLATKLGTIFFFCAATFAFINIVLGGRNGFGMYFDTDLHLFLCCMLLPFVPPEGMVKLERFLHGFFAVNAMLAIFELVSGIMVFPLTTYSPDGTTTIEARAVALLGHPLHAATITCIYIVSLLVGGGKLLQAGWRTPMIVLQAAAMVAFGGRTALVVTLIILMVALSWQAIKFAAGHRFSRGTVMMAIAAIPLGIAIVTALALAGFFDQLLERFTEDGGSARSRLVMFPLWGSFSWGDFLWGPDPDYIRSQMYSFGMEWGIENPFVHISIYQGVVISSLIVLGLLLVFRDAFRRLEPHVIMPMIVYLMLVNTFGSFAGRFLNLTLFMILVSALFRRQDASTRYVV